MANKRIYYAVHAVGAKGLDDNGDILSSTLNAIRGAQSVGITTNFNLEQVFELGQLAIYDNIEDLPDVEVSLTKVLDGYPLIYHESTTNATGPTLAGRSNAKCVIGLEIFDDTQESASGSPGSRLNCSGMFVSSLSYNFPLEDNFTEDVTLVGNNKVWSNDPNATATLPANENIVITPFQNNDDEPTGSGGVNRRENLIMGTGNASIGIEIHDVCAFPLEIPGISGLNGTGYNIDTGTEFGAHLSSISVSADLGREEINELGRRGPYHRVVTFPIEVTCEFEVTSHSGDLISATEDGIYSTGTHPCDSGGNLVDASIRVATCEGTRLWLGTKNKLSSVNYTGGDSGGGNVSVTYSYSTFNDLTVLHLNDPHASGSAWWTARATHLL